MPPSYHSVKKNRAASRRKAVKEGENLVIVGNGMVGAKFCEELIALDLHERVKITVIGEEPMPAYNRVKLSTYVKDRSQAALELFSRSWYEDHQITLKSGLLGQKIDREKKTLELSDGEVLPYDVLILATGSTPFVPPIPGADLPSVFCYRNLHDLDRIIEHAEGKKSATVIGGGLLGIEAAQALQALKLDTHIVERAEFLMPQQLNDVAGNLLLKEIEQQKIKVHTGIQQTSISEKGKGLELTLDGASPIASDLVLISAGIQPNTALAAEAGLQVGVRGGVVVNDDLESSDSAIFAIGECALLHGRIYGLVAPGNKMAKHLAQRLAGKKLKTLAPLDMSTRLKMLGVDVTTIGEPLQEGRRLEYADGQIYRTITIGRNRKIIGALAIGSWPENPKIHEAYTSDRRISTKLQNYFEKEGILFPNAQNRDARDWPDERIICNCTATPKGQIMACLADGQSDPDCVARLTGASTVCGSCRPLLEHLCGAPVSAPTGRKSTLGLLIASLIALVASAYAVGGPATAMADSVESIWYKVDQLWRDNFIKQITGFSLVGVFTIGLLISLRKRLAWFKWGKFASWRFFHSAFGLTSLVVLWAHTGFHFGSNLNFWLMFVFVLLNLLGALAGIVAAIEARSSSERARRLRPILTKAHLILFWPLPVLLTFHILSVYLY